MTCPHKEYQAVVNVNRHIDNNEHLTHITGFVTVRCSHCNMEFFLTPALPERGTHTLQRVLQFNGVPLNQEIYSESPTTTTPQGVYYAD